MHKYICLVTLKSLGGAKYARINPTNLPPLISGLSIDHTAYRILVGQCDMGLLSGLSPTYELRSQDACDRIIMGHVIVQSRDFTLL